MKLMSLTMLCRTRRLFCRYRDYVISAIPSLKSLDFTTITPKDQEKAARWRRMCSPKKKQIV